MEGFKLFFLESQGYLLTNPGLIKKMMGQTWELHRNLTFNDPRNFQIHQDNRFIAQVIMEPHPVNLVGLVMDNKLQAVATYKTQEGSEGVVEIEAIVTAPWNIGQKKRMADYIMAFIEAKAKQDKAKSLELFAMSGSEPAYRRMGFATAPHSDPDELGTTMAKKIAMKAR
jgi:hypothetical protein